MVRLRPPVVVLRAWRTAGHRDTATWLMRGNRDGDENRDRDDQQEQDHDGVALEDPEFASVTLLLLFLLLPHLGRLAEVVRCRREAAGRRVGQPQRPAADLTKSRALGIWHGLSFPWMSQGRCSQSSTRHAEPPVRRQYLPRAAGCPAGGTGFLRWLGERRASPHHWVMAASIAGWSHHRRPRSVPGCPIRRTRCRPGTCRSWGSLARRWTAGPRPGPRCRCTGSSRRWCRWPCRRRPRQGSRRALPGCCSTPPSTAGR